MRNKESSAKKKRPGKRSLVIIGCIILVLLGSLVTVEILKGDKAVEFKVLRDKEIPKEIETQVIPEYRTLERALACMVGKDINVVVSRGEKPSSGYGLSLEKMAIQERDGIKTLIVYADFKEPDSGKALSQVITYPIKVAKTKLKKLPDEIELRIQYEED